MASDELRCCVPPENHRRDASRIRASLGRVADVLATGANDVYIADREGQPPLLIPAIKEVVRLIDVPGGRMVVKLQEELD